MKAPSVETRRDRALSDEEIKVAWRAFSLVGWPFGAVAQLLLLTGARRNEVAAMRWSEVNLAERIWRLPAARSKNKRDHEVPLSDAALRILDGLPRVGDARDSLVFTVTGASAVSGFSKFKATVDQTIIKTLREEAEARGDDPQQVRPPEPWVLHDLRRTVATNLQKLGVRLEVTEAVLNHVSGSRAGIVGVYQRHTWPRRSARHSTHGRPVSTRSSAASQPQRTLSTSPKPARDRRRREARPPHRAD